MKYAIEVLELKLWEWKIIKDKWHTEMLKHGPFQEGAVAYEEADKHIKELAIAIEQLKNIQYQ